MTSVNDVEGVRHPHRGPFPCLYRNTGRVNTLRRSTILIPTLETSVTLVVEETSGDTKEPIP